MSLYIRHSCLHQQKRCLFTSHPPSHPTQAIAWLFKSLHYYDRVNIFPLRAPVMFYDCVFYDILSSVSLHSLVALIFLWQSLLLWYLRRTLYCGGHTRNPILDLDRCLIILALSGGHTVHICWNDSVGVVSHSPLRSCRWNVNCHSCPTEQVVILLPNPCTLKDFDPCFSCRMSSKNNRG